MEPTEVENFDVYVTPLMEGNIADLQPRPTLNQTKKIINRLIDGLEQLRDAGKSHNDLKPANVLFRKENNRLDIRISDFGQANKSGGTPGWTAPIFRNRQPGREDIYSMGMIILWLFCESKELFYALRDNFVQNRQEQWLTRFRRLHEIQLVMKMLDLCNPLSIENVKTEWQKVMPNLQLITESNLLKLGVPANLLTPQYNHNR